MIFEESRARARLFFCGLLLWRGQQGTEVSTRNKEVKKVDEIAAECDICGFEIYRGEVCYRINGEYICEDCVREFAVRFFAPFRREGND